jgi:16S rRNA processing protein RimM
VARLGKTRGLRGELFAIGLSSEQDRYRELNRVFLFDRGGRPLEGGRAWELESARYVADRLVLKFRGVDTVSAAEPLQGADVCIPLSERPALPADEYYETDLVGCSVVERAAGSVLGVVERMLDFGGTALLEVRPAGGGSEILIPLAKSICVEIDPGNRRIAVELPEGLKDLNRP